MTGGSEGLVKIYNILYDGMIKEQHRFNFSSS